MNLPTQRIYETGRHIVVELLIVFVGVYLAFQLNEYSSERETDQRREQVRSALAREIEVFLMGANDILPHLDTLYKDWRRRYDAGEKPVPLHFEVGGVDLPPRGMWQAVVASDGLTLLPVESMQQISDYYNALDILLNKYAALTEFSEREIIPFNNPNTFYEGNKRTLNRKYASYMRRIQDMLRVFETVGSKAEMSKASLME